MKTINENQRFWLAVLVIAGYLLFGALASGGVLSELIPANTVLATMGPLVGWVVKGLFDGAHATGKPDDPVNIEESQP